jgi:hypothetical protein
LVHEVTDPAFELQGFCSEGSGGYDGGGVFLAERLEAGGGERLVLAADTFDFGDEGVGVEGGE